MPDIARDPAFSQVVDEVNSKFARVENIRDIAARVCPFDDLIVQVLELGQQAVNIRDGRRNVGIGLLADASDGIRRDVKRVRHVFGS